MKKSSRFEPIRHIPKYSSLLFEAVQNPMVIYFVVAGNFVMFTSSFLFFHFEVETNPNVTDYFDSLWWALCTVTTVGFGDITPVTFEGRLVGMALMIIGVILYVSTMAILATIITSELAQEVAEADQLTRSDFRAVMDELEQLRKQIQEMTRK